MLVVEYSMEINLKKILFIMTLAVVSLCYIESATANEKVFDIRQLGAKGDGKTIDTDAIQGAIDQCAAAGGGIVQFPAGTYLSKPITLKNNVTLQLDENAKLKATDDRQDFLKPGKTFETAAASSDYAPFIGGKKLTNIAITGKGTIDGSGTRWWIPAEEARAKKSGYTMPRPRLILLENCKNIKIIGVTLVNSPSFHLVPKRCYNVIIDGVTIRAPSIAPNTDAIDPSESKFVRISNCIIDVGDDDVAIKAGSPDPAGPNAASEYITVTNCTFLHGHGMSIGSEVAGGVRNVAVRNCTFKNMSSGIRIKSARGKGGLVENISYSNIKMENVRIPINISSYYQDSPQNDSPQPVTPTTPVYRNIRISNIIATSPADDAVDRIVDFFYYYYAQHAYFEPHISGIIAGLPECLISDISLKDISIKAPVGMTIQNAKDVKLNNVKIETQKGPAFKLDNAQVEGLEQPQTIQTPIPAAEPNHKQLIVLVGDSTVTEKAGWGVGFKKILTDDINCINLSMGGRSSKSFIAEGRWAQALALKGNYYLIQFGHNDEPGKGPERSTDPNTTYRQFMTQYVDDTIAIGAKPILVTSLVRRQWDKSGSGKINSSLIPYVEVVKQIAKEKNVPLIDLHARSKELCEQWGKEKCWTFSPIKDSNQIDNTHLNAQGSIIFARLIIEELGKAVPELKPYLRNEPAP
jgi:polygalacturonase